MMGSASHMYPGAHAKESVFLTASAKLERTEQTVSELSAHHFFTKLKDAKLEDPKIKLVFGANGEHLTVTVSCVAPVPHLFLDPGLMHGHFDDNGMLLLPLQPRTLVFDPAGEADVTVDRLKANVVVRSPYSTQYPTLT